MRDETKETMRMFFGGNCYTTENLEKDYLAELAGYSDERRKPMMASRTLTAVTQKISCVYGKTELGQ